MSKLYPMDASMFKGLNVLSEAAIDRDGAVESDLRHCLSVRDAPRLR
jgi:hypothetical protein